MDGLSKIIEALEESVRGARVAARAEGDRVVLMIRDAPEELRRLADVIEDQGVAEVRAFVTYDKPGRQTLALTAKKSEEEDGEADARPSPKS